MKIAAGLILFLLLTACSDKLSVEQQIIANLRNMEAAAEAGEHFEFMSYVSGSFQGQDASMDRREFHRFMIFQLSQKRRLYAQFFPIRVQEKSAGQAQAQFNLLVTGGSGLLPESGRLFEVKTHWVLLDSEWLLDKAVWEVARLPE